MLSFSRMENGVTANKGEGFLSRMALNDNKAGMEGLDRDKINKIIMETSKGSRFYENELKKEQQVNQRIEKMMLQKAQITEQQLQKAQVQVEKMALAQERSRDLSRVIVHVDMDAFYAAVEMRDRPELKDQPMAVGSMSMLSTSNYHARKFGVRAAMPGFIGKKLCPNLVIVPPNFEKYRVVSNEIREIFADYDPHFQPMSLDEAYLDFTDHVQQRQSWPESSRTHRFHISIPTTIGEEQTEIPQVSVPEENDLSPVLFDDSPSFCPSFSSSNGFTIIDAAAAAASEVFGTSIEEAVREMRFRIEQKTMLTASAGIAPNMMLAKVCSDKNKPNGQYRLASTRDAVIDFIQYLPVRKVSGIGKVSERMLSALGVSSCSDLRQQMALLSLLFSETAWHHLMQVSLGLGSTYISKHEERKSMSTERTFKELDKAEEHFSLCRQLCEDLAEDLKKENLKGKTVTLKLKNVNFEVKTRALTLPCAVATVDEIFAVAKDLLKTEIEHERPQPLRLRLMGVRISAFVSPDDKTHHQKSIVGFLQPGKPGQCGGSVKVCNLSVPEPSAAVVPPSQKIQNQVPWLKKQKREEVGQAGEEPQHSFFQQAHAKRFHLQAKTQVEKESSSVFTATASQSEPSVESESIVSDLPDKYLVLQAEATASTSHCTRTMSRTQSLTCPVCFGEVETTDLNVFNTHIDQCLSECSKTPNQNTETDSESDPDLENKQTNKKREFKEEMEVKKENSIQTSSVITDKSDTSKQIETCGENSPSYVCPVCQLTQDTDDLNVFNRHVDLCLNKEVIHELRGQSSSPIILPKTMDKGRLLTKETSKGKSKRQGCPTSPPSKKAKGLGPVTTIDTFFRATSSSGPLEKVHLRK
uniref:DNA polymerase kappa n=1 Tax=Cynoglossus semilaevis TaxID=244447 RepID=A0A3P8VVY4_CYNSE